ncbi:nuclear transport factor 2 family protein [Rhodococcus spelaei]|uniref:Nuclear transport factor 2 family protein n=1 Tax=Rhodococcus spelaei TaxID=2546320 RepID=A0A541B9M6_9NOCA|nr:nuclear transport factor 2 family protein [Rhodococcus spelaei]TQF69032.1 nuclear transport factor 2 family protein [Rhodococcus spelaei]
MDVVDRMALSDLVGRYAAAVDRRDAATVAGLFTADAEFVQPPALVRRGGSATTVGGDAIASTVLAATAHLDSTHHAVHQQVLDSTDIDAVGQTYCTAHHIYRAKDGALRDNAVAIRYQDRYRKTDGRWQIARRELVVDFADDRAITVP